MTQTLVYRLKNPGEESALAKLWNDYGQWGPAGTPLWNALMVNGSDGPAPVVIAEHPASAEIVGQLAYIRSTVSVRGSRVRALRAFAAILAPTARQSRTLNPLAHPIIEMYQFGAQVFRDQGFGLIYSLPSPTWMTVVHRIGSLKSHVFPVWKLSLAHQRVMRMPVGYEAGQAQPEWHERLDDLQETTSRRRSCLVWRDPTGWRFRAQMAKLRATAVLRNGALKGFVLQTRNRIADVLTVDDDEALVATLTAACNVAQESAASAGTGRWLDILALPIFQPILSNLGFAPADYSYPLVVQPLDPALSADNIPPRDWHITTID